MTHLPRGLTVRRDAGLYGYERALRRHGWDPVAGVDEAGRGACAGPLVAAAVVLPPGDRGVVPGLADSKLLTERARERCHEEEPGDRGVVPGLADSKLLTERARERCHEEVLRRSVAWAVVVVGPEECDRLGMHVANLEALRRALARLETRPAYVLTDGFPVDGLGVPGLAVWKGDRVTACIAAASVLAKVRRDALMREEHRHYPAYDFETHKGYVTASHAAALERHGPCPIHRRRFVNVRRVDGRVDGRVEVGLEVGMEVGGEVGLELPEQVPGQALEEVGT